MSTALGSPRSPPPPPRVLLYESRASRAPKPQPSALASAVTSSPPALTQIAVSSLCSVCRREPLAPSPESHPMKRRLPPHGQRHPHTRRGGNAKPLSGLKQTEPRCSAVRLPSPRPGRGCQRDGGPAEFSSRVLGPRVAGVGGRAPRRGALCRGRVLPSRSRRRSVTVTVTGRACVTIFKRLILCHAVGNLFKDVFV